MKHSSSLARDWVAHWQQAVDLPAHVVRRAIGRAALVSTLLVMCQPGSAAADGGIYMMKFDGGEERLVISVEGAVYHSSPRWSHDGKRLIFETVDDNGVENCCIVNLDGTNLKKLGEMGSPDWSPDDKQVVFHLFGGNVEEEIWVQNIDGEGRNRLAPGAYPRWSPDGSRIAFCDGLILRVLDLEQQEERPLTEDTFAQRPGAFDFSRDGKRLAFFTRTVPGGPRDLYIISTTGTNQGVRPRFSRVGPKVGAHVTWTPGDKQLVFTIDSFIHVLAVEGTAEPTLIPGQSDKSRDPACSPDGKWIVFARRPD